MAFTVRFEKSAQTKLKKVMSLLGVGTANKAFLKMTLVYEADQKKIERLEKGNLKLKNELYELRDLYSQKEQLEKKIIKALTKK